MSTAVGTSSSYPLEHLPEGWYTARVEKKSSGTYVDEIIDNRDPANPIRTPFDLLSDISSKCFAILIGLPFYTAAVMGTHAIRSATLLTTYLVKGEMQEAVASVAQEIWAIVKAPFYAIAMMFWTLPGIFDPLPNRSIIARLEAEWSGSERQYDLLRMRKGEKFPPSLFEYFTDRHSKVTFFLAFCFQPKGSLNDSERVNSYKVLAPNC
jgi:hypothetical protein